MISDTHVRTITSGLHQGIDAYGSICYRPPRDGTLVPVAESLLESHVMLLRKMEIYKHEDYPVRL